MTLPELRSKYERASGARDQVQTRISSLTENEKKLKARMELLEEIQVLFQVTAKETQEQLRFHIEDIVNNALDTCFPGEYSFVVDFQIKRGRTEAGLFLVKEGERIDAMDSAGGGVVDVVSWGLRLSAWTLSKTDAVIVLDEPFKFLSVDLRPLAGEILKTIAERLKLQIIMVSHMEELNDYSDRIFEVSQRKGKSSVRVK